jgi:hypothetical protein
MQMKQAAALSVLLIQAGCIFDTGGVPSTATDAGEIGPEVADLRLPDHAVSDRGLPDLVAPDLPADLSGLDQAAPDQGLPDQAAPDQGLPDQMVPDQAAPDQGLPDQVVPDQAAPDQGLPDQVVPDQAAPDQMVPDQTIAPDKGAIVPITASALGQAFVNTTVQCVTSDGQIQSSTIPVADSSSVSFFNGTVTLAGAGQPTINWVGGLPSVIVVFNPNACDWEDPAGYNEWGSGGLLVRGATLNGSGQLVLQPGLTTQDINTLNVNSDGTFQVDYFEPDDSLLSTFPQLVNPVNQAKQLILQLGNV